MLLLHISDIHFRHPLCASDMDPDRSYRTRLIQDAHDRANELGPVDAILVTGDIAFCGAPEEYTAALGWLSELAAACGCRPIEGKLADEMRARGVAIPTFAPKTPTRLDTATRCARWQPAAACR